jgi:hypothetical protein
MSSERCLLIKGKYELWAMDGGYKVCSYDHRLSNKLNKVTGRYPDYKFVAGEDAIFKGLQPRHLAPLGLSLSYISSLTNSSLNENLTLESTNTGGSGANHE